MLLLNKIIKTQSAVVKHNILSWNVSKFRQKNSPTI